MTLHARATSAVAVLGLTVGIAMAQTAPASPASPASSPSDRAVRDADKVYRMILMHADKPRRATREAARDERVAPPAPVVAAAAATTAVATMNAEAAERLALPSRVDAALPTGVAPPPALAPQALPSMRSMPALAAVQEPRAPEALELLSSVPPAFPQRLLRTLGPGSVVVEFDVAPDGKVTRAEVVRSPHRGLHSAALAAVSAWRFKPPGATRPGVAELKFE